MANICITNYVIEGEKKELDALYETMKKLQDSGASVEYATGLGLLVEALGKVPDEVMCRGGWTELERKDDTLRITFETAWTPCYEVTDLMKAIYPSLRIFYKAEEPGCEVYLKNDADGKYFPETESDGHPFDLMTEESEQEQVRLIHAIQEGKIKLEPVK